MTERREPGHEQTGCRSLERQRRRDSMNGFGGRGHRFADRRLSTATAGKQSWSGGWRMTAMGREYHFEPSATGRSTVAIKSDAR